MKRFAGLVSAAGATIDQAWARLVAGESAVKPIQRFDVSSYPSRMAAEISATAETAAIK